MSEETQIEVKEEENAVKDAIDVNVALVIAERDSLLEVIIDKDVLIEELTRKLAHATDLIEEDSKAGLIKEIAPKTSVDAATLATMKYDDLLQMKKVLDVAQIPAFKAGTPVSYKRKTNPRQQLDNMFENNFAKLKGGKD